MICQQKTGKKQLKLWTDRLHDAVKLALKSNTSSRSQSMYLIRGRIGQRYTRDGFNSTWSPEQKAAYEAGALPARSRFMI
ncbi:hypothetical protein ACJJIO_18140 [Microbulbifer sp. TRSA005]|uniref:hypothetical protein n=1 Tax=Microbulbifer sp. ANSA002 TaxID=3243359 RepID=UPI004041CCD8